MQNLQTHNVAQQSCATYGRFQRELAQQLCSITQQPKHLSLPVESPNPWSTSTLEHSSIPRVTNEPKLHNELMGFKLFETGPIYVLLDLPFL